MTSRNPKITNTLKLLFVVSVVLVGLSIGAAGQIPALATDSEQLADTAAGVSSEVDSPNAVGECGINSVQFVSPYGGPEPVDRDGDGYVSRFTIEMHFDSECYGEYDDGLVGDGPIEPAMELYIEGVQEARILNFEDYTRSGDATGEDVVISLTLKTELYDELSRGQLDFRVVFYDNDPPHSIIVPATQIEEWTGSLSWEPPSED